MSVPNGITTHDFLKGLQERVSINNARMLLATALVQTGLQQEEGELSAEQAKSLCLQLIKQGGPAFQVGQTLYRRMNLQ